jgi:hypothetical protein
MGRVIIKFKDGHLESFKCKSMGRAAEVAARRPDAISWNYYHTGERIPQPKKKRSVEKSLTIEEMEAMLKRGGLI